MEDEEMNEDFAKKLQDVLERIEIQENSLVLDFVNELDSLKEQKIQLEGNQIYASKELEATVENESNKDETIDKVKISNEIFELHSGLNNHRLIHTLAQKIKDNVQIQDSVFNSFKSMDVDETVDQYPDRGELLSHYSQNLNVSQKLKEVIDEKTQLEQDILNLRIKYCNAMKQIKDKWILIEKKSTGEYEGENESPDVKSLRVKVKERSNKLRMLAVILQSLITCTGIDWGNDKRLLQVLILCDSALSLSKQKNLQNDINILENLKSQTSDEPRTHRSPVKRSRNETEGKKQPRLSDYLVRKK